MQIIEIKNKESLNNFLSEQKMSELTQSFEWGGFQEQTGKKIIRLGVVENDTLLAAATIIKETFYLGKSYFFCPRGPIFKDNSRDDIFDFLFSEIKKITIKNKAIFLRFEPKKIILNKKFKIKKTIDREVSKTVMLDLRNGEEEILNKMHPKTRYNIRLAEKKQVEIIEAGAEKFDEFWELIKATSARDEFRTHSKNYYEKMILSCAGNKPGDKSSLSIKLIFAKYKDKLLAANILVFFGDTATYLHGASSNESRNVMAPYALQWHCIQMAKKLNYDYYDFRGIDEKKWPGVTRFKRGFTNQEINYPGTFDLIFDNKFYSVYKFLRKLKRLI